MANNKATKRLFNACIEGVYDWAEEAIDLGADVDAYEDDSCGDTPLCSAAYYQRTSIVKLLILNFADVNKRARDASSTPLINAVKKDNTEIVKILIKAHAIVTKQALDLAESEEMKEILRSAMQAPKEKDTNRLELNSIQEPTKSADKDDSHEQIIRAIMSEDVEMIKALRASGVDFNKEIKIPDDIYIPGLMSIHCPPEFLAATLNKSQALNAMIEYNGVDDILENMLDQGYPFEPEISQIIRQAAYLKHKQPSKLTTNKVPMSFTADKVKMSAQRGRSN